MSLAETIVPVNVSENGRKLLARSMSLVGADPISSLLSEAALTRGFHRSDAIAVIRSATSVEKIDWTGGAPMDGVTYRFNGPNGKSVELDKAVDAFGISPFLDQSFTIVRLIQNGEPEQTIFKGLKATLLYAIAERLAQPTVADDQALKAA